MGREGACVVGVVSSVARVAARVARPGDRPSYRISSARRAGVAGSIDNSRADGREKIRRFLIVMALADLWGFLVLFTQPLSSPLALLFTFFFSMLAGPVLLGGQPEAMASGDGGAGGTAIARQGMRGLEALFTVFQQAAPLARLAGACVLQNTARRTMLRAGHGRSNSRRSSLGREWLLPAEAFSLTERSPNSDWPVDRNQQIPAKQSSAGIPVKFFAGTDSQYVSHIRSR